jgi:RNA polymerase sigma-B factor
VGDVRRLAAVRATGLLDSGADEAYRGRADLDDLDQVASLGLLKAIERFDPERGIAFSTFAVPTISGELKRYFRDLGWAVRVPREIRELTLHLTRATEELAGEYGRSPTAAELASRTSASIEQVLEARAAVTAHHPDSLDQPSPDDGEERLAAMPGGEDPGFARAEDVAYVDRLLRELSDRERAVVRLRFEQDLTQAEIGRRLGVSQMQVSRLLRRSIATL